MYNRAKLTATLFVALTTLLLGANAVYSQETKIAPLEQRAMKLLQTQLAEIPSKRTPLSLRVTARCIAVFPSVVKAGLIIGVERGQGLVSCRRNAFEPWGAPAVFNISSASVGLQAGIQDASIVLLALNQKGVDAFLDESVGLSGDVGIAAGPVGGAASREGLPGVISYVRTQGLFAGLDLGATQISSAKKRNSEIYGKGTGLREILLGQTPVPDSLKPYHALLSDLAPRGGQPFPDDEY